MIEHTCAPAVGKRILFYIDTYRPSYGSLHSDLCTQLRQAGWIADMKSWTHGYVISEFANEVSQYDYVVTMPWCRTRALVDTLDNSYHIPRER